MAIAHRSEVRIYDRTGTGSYTALPVSGLSFSTALGGSGFCSFEIDARYAAIASSPTMLDDCVIKVAVPLDGTDTPTEIAAYANRSRNGVLWDGSGRQVRQVRSAPSLWTAWSQDAILHAEGNTIPQLAAEQRWFGPMSSIYDPANDAADWLTPEEVFTQATSTGDRAGNPDGWPTALADAMWIKKPTAATGLRRLYMTGVTVPTAGYITVYFSADEASAVYFAGSLILQSAGVEFGYQTVDTWTAYVEAGTYRLCVDNTSVRSGADGDGVDPILCAVATVDSTGAVVDVLKWTDATWDVWVGHPVTGEPPSLTPGEIMLQLHTEAAARGVDTWEAITPTFTASADSASTAWGLREERTWRVGFDRHLDMVEALGDLGVDIEVTPGLDWNAYYERGTDLSATVVVEALVDVAAVTESGSPVEGTVLYIETQDGWAAALESNVATYGRRESALSLGNSPSIAQGTRLGTKVLEETLSRPQSEWTVDCYAKAGAVPLEDFGLGDTIGVRINGVTTPRVVLEIGGSAPSTSAIVRWAIKTGDVA